MERHFSHNSSRFCPFSKDQGKKLPSLVKWQSHPRLTAKGSCETKASNISVCFLKDQVQRITKTSKFILGLPFMCDLSHKDRLISTELLPLSYWHEYLDLIFFFKAITGSSWEICHLCAKILLAAERKM